MIGHFSITKRPKLVTGNEVPWLQNGINTYKVCLLLVYKDAPVGSYDARTLILILLAHVKATLPVNKTY